MDAANSSSRFDDPQADLRVEEICIAFDKALQSGENPTIKEYLLRANSASIRRKLFRALLQAELHDRPTAPDAIAAYLGHFPEYKDIICEEFQNLMAAPRTDDTTEAARPDRPIACENRQTGLPDFAIPSEYQFVKRVGSGGFGTVWKYWDKSVQRHVAIKCLRSEHLGIAPLVKLFDDEAKILAIGGRGPIPGIPAVYRTISDGRIGTRAIVMEWIEGVALDRKMAESQIENGVAGIRLIAELAKILGKLHAITSGRVVHRDVKPANIIIASNKPVLVDLGLALNVVGNGTILPGGTPGYWAPEQILGETVDPRTDVFALGVILYQLLVNGKQPFDTLALSDDPRELVQQMRRNPPSPPCALNPDHVLEPLSEICLKWTL